MLLAAFQTSPTPFIILLAVGFAVGAFGHLIESKPVVAAGILMIFLATFLLPLAINIAQ